MLAETREWIEKADDDFRVSGRELRARRNPSFDATCFHAQQCVEKYLKAVLVEHGVVPRKIHDLVALMNDCMVWCPLWAAMGRDLELLSQYAVLARYPGETATREKAREAVVAMKRVRREIRDHLGISYGSTVNVEC